MNIVDESLGERQAHNSRGDEQRRDAYRDIVREKPNDHTRKLDHDRWTNKSMNSLTEIGLGL